MPQSNELPTSPKERREARGWKVPLPSTGYRRPLVGGTETAVYCDFLRAGTTLARCRQSYGQIVIMADGGICDLTTYDENDSPIVHRLVGGQVAFIAPQVWHSYQWIADGEILVIYTRPAFLRKTLHGREWSGIVIGEFVIVAHKDSTIWFLASLCRRIYGDENASERKLVERLGHSLALRAVMANFGAADNRPKLPMLTAEQQKTIFAHLDANLRRMPSVTELAKLIAVSPLHFIRLFRNSVGMPPKRYQSACRMRKAETLLLSGRYLVKQIADELGFSSVSYFDRCFHKFFGTRPKLYSEEKRKCNHLQG